jgi:hypothetical protein
VASGKGGIGRKILKVIAALFALLLVYFLWFWAPVLWDVWQAGMLDKVDKREYHGTSMDNLRALHTGLMLYHDSEGQFPFGSGWMDAVLPRIGAGDMKKEESAKKLVHPMFWPPNGKEFGYAFNDSCSEKYIEDIEDPERTPLVFDSSDTGRNAHGDPSNLLPNPPREGGNQGVSVSGAAIKF